MVLAVIVGIIFKQKAAPLGIVANWIITLIKNIAIPLLFFAILDTIVQQAIRGRNILTLILIALINACCAITIALSIINLFQPGKYLSLLAPESMPQTDFDSTHYLSMALSSPMIIAILSAIVIGSFIRCCRVRVKPIIPWISRILGLILRIMSYVVYLVPIAVFGSVAKVIGQYDFSIFKGLSAYVLFCLLGMSLHICVVYQSWILGVAKIPLKLFWKHALEPVLHGFGINSSLATLPVTLKALKDLGVSDNSARLSTCIGTNFNNDGILLYEVFAILFLTQSYGIDLSLSAQLATAGLCIVATVGVSGVPEAGVIALTIVMGMLKIPLEHIPLLLTVDWILARTRSLVNVTADMTVAVAIDALIPKGAHPLSGRKGDGHLSGFLLRYFYDSNLLIATNAGCFLAWFLIWLAPPAHRRHA